jgi:N utilization substance protein B
MGLTRSELREKIITILYQIELYTDNKLEYSLDDLIKENLEIDNEFVKEMVYGITTYKNEIDEIANEYLNNWTIDRLDSMGRQILRLGI